MRVPRGHCNIGMAQDFLQLIDAITAHDELTGESMAKIMEGYLIDHSGHHPLSRL